MIAIRFAVLFAVIGVMLFHFSLAMTLRANPNRKVPYFRNAEVIPKGSRFFRIVGAGLLTLGALLLSTVGWYWPFIVVAAGPVAALVVIRVHNNKVARRVTR